MGGRSEHFGPVLREPNEPVFHARWEGRVFGMASFVAGLFGGNIEAARRAMEELPPELYMSGYYRRWLGGLERQLVRGGYLGPEEVDARLEGRRGAPGTRATSRIRLAITARVMRAFLRPALPRWIAGRLLPRLIGTARPAIQRRRYAVGDRVRVRDRRAPGFTRQPGYVTGKPGIVTAHHGATLFPDAHAFGRRARPQHLYTVSFDGGELWGAAAEHDTEVRVDLYESYLERT
jgi:nitrile hydratase beta subunit